MPTPQTLKPLQLLTVSMLVVLFASCGDSRDMFSPSPSGTKLQGTIAAARADKEDPSAENAPDELPDNMSGVATYLAGVTAPADRSESAVIGPLGGSLRLGDFEMIVPPGAVTTATRFSITTFAEGNTRKHAIASFMPHRTFAAEITLRVPLNTTESAGDTEAHVIWLDKSEWVPLPSTITSDGRLETKTFHFSCYGTQYRGFTLVGG